ncbi:MAG TPA: RlmE family RNA methyltransferase [Alphaproteobacteria bacterium]|nr:RlmE family RNA methyltransferase [Alphaproteobacteria bacterium]
MPVKPAKKFTSKRLSASSKAYLNRQAADSFVQAARAQGYRARSAFKLQEIDQKHKLFRHGQTVVDLGAAPGSWCQVAAEKVGPTHKGGGRIVGIDLLEIPPLAGITFIEADFTSDEGLGQLLPHVQPEGVDVVMSDMAANTTGHHATDGLRTMALAELAADFALTHLKPGGHFLTKVFMNGDEAKLRDTLRPHFTKVMFVKPGASRAESREIFLLALNKKA